MKGRWSISTDGGIAWVEVNPLNAGKLGFTDARDLGNGQVFFRRKLKAALLFGGDDYDLLYPFEFNPTARCNDLLVRFEEYCTTWSESWRGVFSAGKGTWDLDTCTFEVKPDVVDQYTCLLEQSKIKRNVLQVAPVDASAASVPSIEWSACVVKLVNIIGPVYESACSDDLVLNSSADTPDNWWNAVGFPIDPPNVTLLVYWREYLITECVGGSPAPPPGAGWLLLENNCSTNGTAKYIREPEITFAFDIQEGTCVDNVAIPPAVDCDQPWTELTPCGLVVDGEEYPPYFVCYDPAQVNMNRARRFDEVVEYLIDQTGCPIAGLRSDFFERNAVGDAVGYVAGENYVTGELNQVSNIVQLQKSDAIDPDASNPATIGEWSFDSAMKFCFDVFRCLWFIDADGYVRIEHCSYFVASAGIELPLLSGVVEPLKYDHLSDRIPRIERARWAEAQGRDFVGRDLIYSGPCVSGGDREVEEISPGPYTTDISYVFNDSDAIGKDGFVFLATNLVGGVHETILAVGALSGNLISNGPLSWANLQDAFWRSDRYLPTGNMNGADTEFDGWRPNVEQKDVSLPRCCDTYAIDPLDSIGTSLGARLLPARRASVESVDHDIDSDRMTLTLRYQY